MTRRPGDDLFEDTRMSFGEHLEELRKRLVRCLIFVGAGCGIGFLVAEDVVNFLQKPLIKAIKEYNDGAALKDYTARIGYYPPEIEDRLQAGLAPQTAYIDPGELVKAIRSISPDSLSEIDLTPYRFMTDWISPEDASVVAREIIDANGGDSDRDKQLLAIKDLLDDTHLAAIRRLANMDAKTVTSTERGQMVDALNFLIDKPAIHQHAAFQSMMIQPDWSYSQLFKSERANQLALMKIKVDEDPEDEELSRRLNRLLVARVFPGQIESPTIDLVPIAIWQNITEGTQALSPHEVFMVWIKAAIVTGLVLSGPLVFYQIWMFVAVGLYPHEQKYVYYYLPLSILLFVFGICLAFFFVFDPVLKFLFSFNSSMGISPQLRIGEWLSFVMFLPLGFGIAFQLPLVMLFTNRVGLVSVELYKTNWRLAVMIISVLSMLLTPADPISMIMLGGPLTLLFFFGIGLCKWMPRPENPFGDEAAVTAS